MISKHLAELVLGKALSTGADFAEIYVESTVSNSIGAVGGFIDSANSSFDSGAGIRIFNGTQTLYTYTNDLTEIGLLKAAQKLANALSLNPKEANIVLRPSIIENRHPIVEIPKYVDNSRKAAIILEASRIAKSYDPCISQVQSNIGDVERSFTVANSEGLFKSDSRINSRFSVVASANKDGETQSFGSRPGAFMGMEFLDSLDIEHHATLSAKTAITLVNAPSCPSGVMPVVIENGFGGVIFHEACGHALEATSVGIGSSVFTGKMGMQIASKCVNAVDDGTLVNSWGSVNIDDEGTPSQRNLLIKDGILNSYLIDRLGSRRMNMPMTGSARRENYRYAPTSRMTNTFICDGTDDNDEMIRSMGDGLYCASLGGGSVNPATSEFNFNVIEAYVVKDGKIAHPVRGATLIGKGNEVLMDIDRVGTNLHLDQGMCGSVSGSIPTNVGQPRIRVKKMIVGGK